jgi:hypothetical protein
MALSADRVFCISIRAIALLRDLWFLGLVIGHPAPVSTHRTLLRMPAS